MPIRPVPLPIQFAGGVETKTDAKQVPQTKLLTCENATFVKGTTLAKRNGYVALGRLTEAGGTYGTAIGIGERDGELVLFDGVRAWSHRPSSDTWSDTGDMAACTMINRPIARTGTQQTMLDQAQLSGVRAAAWEDSRGGVRMSVIEAETGRILLADTQLHATAQCPRACVCGSVIHVYYLVAALGQIWVAIVNPAIPSTAPVPQLLIDDVRRANAVYDAVTSWSTTYADTNPVSIAWSCETGGHRVAYVHPSGVLGSAVTGLPGAATFSAATDTVDGPIGIVYDRHSDSVVAVAWGDNASQVRVRFVTSTSLVTFVYTGVVTSIFGTSWLRVALDFTGLSAGGFPILWWAADTDRGLPAQPDQWAIETGALDATGTLVQASRQLRGHVVAGRAFYDQGNAYLPVAHAPQFFPYAAVIRLSTSTLGPITPCFARILPGSLYANTTRKHVPSSQSVDPETSGLDIGNSARHEIALGYRIQLSGSSATQWSEAGAMVCALDFSDANAYRTQQLGRGLYLAGACPQRYDGASWAEADFHTAPDTVSGVTWVSEGAAGALGAGTYGYKIVYEEIDAQGERRTSAPSVQQNVTIGASKKVNVTIPTLRLTARSRVRIGVFRTPQGQTGDPDQLTFYRVTSTDPTASGDNGYVVNDPTVDTILFVDNITDATLIGLEPLYTNGGILPNNPVQIAGGVIAGGKSRLFATDPVDPHLVRFSQQIGDDEGVAWPIDLSTRIDPYGGDVIGLGIVDDTVVAFTATAIYGFGGPGPQDNPNADPQSFSFSPPRLITSDVGCKSPGSICQSPLGIVFQSSKGIKMLDRTLNVVDIGSAVYAYNDQTVRRATLLPDRHQIVFLTDDGSTLLWDYQRDQWSTFTNHEGLDALVLDGTYHYLRTDGRVFAETPGSYVDDNSHIVMRIETAWIKLGGYLQGWQRILWAFIIGEFESDHLLGVRYRTDYNDAWSEQIQLDVGNNYNPSVYGAGAYGVGEYGGPGGDETRYQRAIHLNKRCQSIQFRFEDIEDVTEYGASYQLSELLLIGGVLGPAFKLPAARRN